jgi:hypothetical protein
MWRELGENAERNALQLPPRRAAQDDLKKCTISRALGRSAATSHHGGAVTPHQMNRGFITKRLFGGSRFIALE